MGLCRWRLEERFALGWRTSVFALRATPRQGGQKSEIRGQRADSKRRGDAEIRRRGETGIFSRQQTAGSFRKFQVQGLRFKVFILNS